VAQYIDNAIQACGESSTRSIRVCRFLDEKVEEGCLAIMDSGIGMDIATIQEFATYSLDQASRGKKAGTSDTTFIGKFGVGAKQAGFYLGTRITLFTRPHAGDVLDSVYHFCLDEDVLKQRQSNGEIAFGGTVFKIPTVSIAQNLPFPESRYSTLHEVLLDHFSHNRCGSAFVINLRPDIVKKLKSSKDDKQFQIDIKNIYHCQLHPDHTASKIGQLPQFSYMIVSTQ
jgi:hypothetical protein